MRKQVADRRKKKKKDKEKKRQKGTLILTTIVCNCKVTTLPQNLPKKKEKKQKKQHKEKRQGAIVIIQRRTKTMRRHLGVAETIKHHLSRFRCSAGSLPSLGSNGERQLSRVRVHCSLFTQALKHSSTTTIFFFQPPSKEHRKEQCNGSIRSHSLLPPGGSRRLYRLRSPSTRPP